MPEKPPVDFPKSCLEAPPFWISGLDECYQFMRSLPGVEEIDLGRSAGGRPILAGAWGEREPIQRTSTSLSSSMGAVKEQAWNYNRMYPESFFGKPRRKPVLVFQGNVHGAEIEGTVAAMNLLNLLVRGVDLRGQKHDRLLEEARKMRIVVIPHANPDGRVRWEPAKHIETMTTEQQQKLIQGHLPDGTPLEWPTSKSIFPIPKGSLFGPYYNDHGVNLQHDRFLDDDRAPETNALLGFYLKEMPDAVILAHTDQGSCMGSIPAYVPVELQMIYTRISGAVDVALRRKGLPIFTYPDRMRPGGSTRAFTQPDAVYHQCGATPLQVEFACSRPSASNALSFDQILDIGLTILETILIYGNDFGFRPLKRDHVTGVKGD